VEFSLHLPEARAVQLAADFTDWERSPIDMVPFEDGCWSTTVPLPAGIYAYRFLVDGRWYDDPLVTRLDPDSSHTSEFYIQIK
jgi:1,4-alpha-glucan branching enzyme